jgi:hypothetical protein
MHELIVGDWQLDDSPIDLGCHGNHIGTHCAVASPGRPHVGAPHCPNERRRNRDRRKREQERNDSEPRLARGTGDDLGRPNGIAVADSGAAPRWGFEFGHFDLNGQPLASCKKVR